jgi:large subunit ribosomal protein L23
MELTEIIKSGVITEKSVRLQIPTEPKGANKEPTHQYVFKVALTANKIQIRKAVEAMFENVTVLKVNTLRMPGKSRSLRTMKGVRQTKARQWKKAIVTVRATETITELQP